VPVHQGDGSPVVASPGKSLFSSAIGFSDSTRSILHALNDNELSALADDVAGQITHWPVVEKDRWTIWAAHKKVEKVAADGGVNI